MKRELERISGRSKPPKLLTQVKTIKIENLEDQLLGKDQDDMTWFHKLFEEEKKKPLKKHVKKSKITKYHVGQVFQNSHYKNDLGFMQLDKNKNLNNKSSNEITHNKSKEKVNDERDDSLELRENDNLNKTADDVLKAEHKETKKSHILREHNDSPLISSFIFKSISRNRRELYSNKSKLEVPSIGKYNPKYRMIETKDPVVVMPKELVDRSQYFVKLSPCQSSLLPKLVKSRNLSNLRNQNYSSLLTNKRKIENFTLQGNLNEQSQLQLHPIDDSLDHDQQSSFDQTSQQDIDKTFQPSQSKLELTNRYGNLKYQIRNLKESRKQSLTPLKFRSIADGTLGIGVLDFSKIPPRKDLFENMPIPNDERFKYVELPQIYSKTKRVQGDAYFSKVTPRRDLFKLPSHILLYEPKNDELVRKRVPKIIKILKEKILNDSM